MTRADAVRELAEKGEHSLGAARELLKSGYPDFSAARCYYAMFYLAQAALLHKNLEPVTHSGVISSFSKEFVKPGTFGSAVGQALSRAFDLRSQADYSTKPVSQEDAETALTVARSFEDTVKEFLRAQGYDTGQQDA